MNIQCELSDLAHRYGKKSLFRNLNTLLKNGEIHLITGANGSGKSTLLRLISSAMELEHGSIRLSINGREAEEESLRNEISLVAPYQELPEEFTLAELIAMQQQFLSAGPDATLYQDLVSHFGLEENLHKTLSNFSTGMKQKARFVLALGMDRPVWLLDEPGANLDVKSCALLHQLLRENCEKRLIILASNDPAEIALGEVALSL